MLTTLPTIGIPLKLGIVFTVEGELVREIVKEEPLVDVATAAWQT
jgi:hypothetical protein